MSARNKARGYELEREVVVAAEAAGLEAKRVFGSGAHKAQLGEDFADSLLCPSCGHPGCIAAPLLSPRSMTGAEPTGEEATDMQVQGAPDPVHMPFVLAALL